MSFGLKFCDKNVSVYGIDDLLSGKMTYLYSVNLSKAKYFLKKPQEFCAQVIIYGQFGAKVLKYFGATIF